MPPSGDADVGVDGDAADDRLGSSKLVGDTTRSDAADSTESTDGREPASDCEAVRDRSGEIRSDVDVLEELALVVGITADRL